MKIEDQLIEQQLYEFIETRTFVKLSDDEQAFVLRHMTIEEYSDQHQLTTSLFEIEAPSTQTKPSDHLATRLFNDTTKPSHFSRIIQMRVPAYTLAAAVIGLLILFSVLKPDNVPSTANALSVTSEIIHDTLIVIKEVVPTHLHDSATYVRQIQNQAALGELLASQETSLREIPAVSRKSTPQKKMPRTSIAMNQYSDFIVEVR